MFTFTLDTNCIIAIDEGRAEATAVHALATAHASGGAKVAIVAITASEKQRGGHQLENFLEFQERLVTLKLAHLELLPSIFYFDITFWDCSIPADAAMEALERKIHEVLFPNIEFLWQDYCKVGGFMPSEYKSDHKWLNAKCDVLALWTHVYHRRDVFVTSDQNFHNRAKKSNLIKLGANKIETPDYAIKYL